MSTFDVICVLKVYKNRLKTHMKKKEARISKRVMKMYELRTLEEKKKSLCTKHTIRMNIIDKENPLSFHIHNKKEKKNQNEMSFNGHFIVHSRDCFCLF